MVQYRTYAGRLMPNLESASVCSARKIKGKKEEGKEEKKKEKEKENERCQSESISIKRPFQRKQKILESRSSTADCFRGVLEEAQ